MAIPPRLNWAVLVTCCLLQTSSVVREDKMNSNKVVVSPFAMDAQIRLAYYCSGHGYGHATRVSAFASSLMSLEERPEIFIVSSAPTHVFSECIRRGAHYRYADIDPIISQPLAYKVDRQKSVQVLRTFLSEKNVKLAVEVAWLTTKQIDCVLSDAAFLACEAATQACIPSILITNFTFDSVYSYLGAEIPDHGPGFPNDAIPIPEHTALMQQDSPIPPDVLEPLVSQVLAGYQHADILLLLPGFIPIPSFFRSPTLPATAWVNPITNRFRPDIISTLLSLPTSDIHPAIPSPVKAAVDNNTDGSTCKLTSRKKPERIFKYAPLLVRPASPSINTLEARQKLLASIGIPDVYHDPSKTHILLVSFGGQTIRRPYGGKSPSRTPPSSENVQSAADNPAINPSRVAPNQLNEGCRQVVSEYTQRPTATFSRKGSTKIFIPGAPAPANNPASPRTPNNPLIPPTIHFHEDGVQPLVADAMVSLSPADPTFSFVSTQEEEPSLLPSSDWIAIICGVPSNWSLSGDDEEEDLPPGFYVAPPDVYMPDLTAIADVLLGKLGYGTVSESVAQSTPFVYVPRPLFVEEHGLRLLLEAEGTGVELSRHEYESGRWAKKVEEAYLKGKETRHAKSFTATEQQVKDLASWVLKSVRIWKHQQP